MAITGSKLPRFRESDVADPRMFVRRLNEFVTTLELRFAGLEGPLVNPRSPAAGEEVYAVTNVTEDRTFDANSTSTDELADVLGTLITDLINEDKLR